MSHLTEPSGPAADPVAGMARAPRTAAGAASPGLPDETRRLAAGIRAISAMLCTAMLVGGPPLSPLAVLLLLAYDLWAGVVLWAEAVGRPVTPRLQPGVDVAWAVLMIGATDSGTQMLLLTLVQPVVLATVGQGVRQGMVLACLGALGLALAGHFAPVPDQGVPHLGLVGMALALVPAAALLSRPMNRSRQRLALLRDLLPGLDARRGLAAVCGALTEALRLRTGANVVAVVLPASAGAPAVISTAGEGAFRAGSGAHARLEALLDELPAYPVSREPPGLAGWAAVSRRVRFGRRQGEDAVAPALVELSTLLESPALRVVPLHRYGQRHGWLLLGGGAGRLPDAALLADLLPDLFHVIEQATLVDRLQAETATHERARIGRDLHDSVVQPFAALQLAVESVAARAGRDDPLRGDLQELAGLARLELAELRERIAGMREGPVAGEDALVAALRRQVARFSTLFGVAASFEVDEALACPRPLAGAVFHLLDEALNNIRQHTLARHVRVGLGNEAGALVLSARDDGPAVSGRPAPVFVPGSMAGRAQELGGTLEVRRPDSGSTEVVVRLPVAVLPRRPAPVSTPGDGSGQGAGPSGRMAQAAASPARLEAVNAVAGVRR